MKSARCREACVRSCFAVSCASPRTTTATTRSPSAASGAPKTEPAHRPRAAIRIFRYRLGTPVRFKSDLSLWTGSYVLALVSRGSSEHARSSTKPDTRLDHSQTPTELQIVACGWETSARAERDAGVVVQHALHFHAVDVLRTHQHLFFTKVFRSLLVTTGRFQLYLEIRARSRVPKAYSSASPRVPSRTLSRKSQHPHHQSPSTL